MASTLEEAKKFLEGWTSYKSEQAKGSKKCWMVLRGTSILLFSSDKPNKDMLGSLSLGPGTCMTDIKSKREFKFELSTTNREGQFQKGVFKFNKESDYHLWKAYIVAIATGSIPPDARLLPGQQSDIYEAMVEVRKQNSRAGGSTATASSSSSSRRQTALPAQPPPPSTQSPSSPGRALDTEDYDGDGDVDDPAIRQLNKRLEELAEREINDRDLTASSVSSWPINEIVLDTTMIRPKGGPPPPLSSSNRPVATAEATVASAPTTTTTNQNNSTTVAQSKRASFLFANHAFYSDGIRNNSVTPSWFVNCSRDQAEEILASDGFGTILMRASSGFPINGNYVLSFRREVQGKIVVCHYNILRTEDGFKIDVENKHSPMQSLSAVMDFFSSVAGKSAKPLTSNNLTELLGKYQAEAFPPVVEKETVQRRPISGGSSSVHSRDSVHSQPPPPPMTQSGRSSFAEGQDGSSARNSRGSFEFSGSRRTSDAHSHRLPFHADDRRNSSASSSVFYHHHQGHATEVIGGSSPPPHLPSQSSYGGSFSGSVNGSGSAAKALYSGSRSVSMEEAAPSNNNDNDQVYSNHSETLAPTDNGVSGGEDQRYRGSVGQRGSDAFDASRSTLGSSVGLNNRGFNATQTSRNSMEQQQQQQQQQQQPNAGYYGFDRSESSSSSYGGTVSKQMAPAPPPKPGAQEIYQLMKPLPPSSTAGGEYSSSSGSEVYRASNGVDLEMPTSVKELARMIKCSLEK